MRYLTNIILLIFISSSAQPQPINFKRIEKRNIIINSPDSIIKASIIVNNVGSHNLSTSVYYFWYKNNKIHYNEGGYFGNLLHDKYMVFSIDEKLLTEGYFNKGLKSGTWKKWFPSGKLKQITQWSSGVKDGFEKKYDDQGALVSEENYENGQRNGECIYHTPHGTIKRYYINGTISQPEEKETSIFTRINTWIKTKLFSKKRKEKSDTSSTKKSKPSNKVTTSSDSGIR